MACRGNLCSVNATSHPGILSEISFAVVGARPGDVAGAAHDRVGMAKVLVAANVASAGAIYLPKTVENGLEVD